jgi:hypothetical protein
MAYVCELGPHQRVYLDNQGAQTIVTTMSGGPGQQQQASCSFQTGNWTASPELYQVPSGVVVKIATATGDRLIQIQGGSMSLMGTGASVGGQQMQVQQTASMPAAAMPTMQPMPPMPPMQPMQPMKMGDMQMSLNPMEMRMGDMAMQMGTAASASASTSGTRRFCSQCGAAVQPSDRFCSSCGHGLG